MGTGPSCVPTFISKYLKELIKSWNKETVGLDFVPPLISCKGRNSYHGMRMKIRFHATVIYRKLLERKVFAEKEVN